MTIKQQLHKSATHKAGFDPACPACAGNEVVERDFRAIAKAIKVPGGNVLDQWEIKHLTDRRYSIEINGGSITGLAEKTNRGWKFTWEQ